LNFSKKAQIALFLLPLLCCKNLKPIAFEDFLFYKAKHIANFVALFLILTQIILQIFTWLSSIIILAAGTKR